MEEEARALDGTVKTMTAAKKWMTDHAGALPQPVGWNRLPRRRARSGVNYVRRATSTSVKSLWKERQPVDARSLGGSVDGQPTKALSVMSQGEQHALALALFLPRATAANSPFRFIVLDDPIQAMDPAKIDGFVQVLSEVAQTHQVIVFSHDDRLASVIRETGSTPGFSKWCGNRGRR